MYNHGAATAPSVMNSSMQNMYSGTQIDVDGSDRSCGGTGERKGVELLLDEGQRVRLSKFGVRVGRSQEGGDRDTEAQKVPDSFGKARKGSGAALAICSKHHSTACLVAQTFIIFPVFPVLFFLSTRLGFQSQLGFIASSSACQSDLKKIHVAAHLYYLLLGSPSCISRPLFHSLFHSPSVLPSFLTMSRVRYQPYPKRLPLVSVDEDRFSGVFSDLEKMNIVEGKICTFDHHIGQWIEVPRPQRVSPVSGKIYDIAASGFDKYWTKYEGPILCPHKKRTGGTYDPLVLCLQGNYEGRTADFYRALDHSCCFKVVIPPLKEKKVLITWEERRVHAADQDHDQDEDEDDLDSSPLPSHAPQGKNRSQVLRHISSSPAHPMNDDSTSSSQSSQSASNGRDRPASQSSTTSVSSSGSTISTRVVEAIVRPHPRSSGPREPTPTKLRATPLNIGGGTVLQGRSPRAYYGLSVAEARKQYDSDIMSFVQDISEPTVHPAWNPDSPPTVLELYDDRIYPACRPCMNDNLDFLYLPLGQSWVFPTATMLLWLDLQRVADVASTISHPTDMNITVAKGYAQTIQNSNPFRPVKNSMKQTYADARSVKTQGLFSRGKHWKQLLVVHCWHGTPDLGFQPMFGY
ncbi:hypothetical protein DFH08DRAFT_943704 [Mycena albidolilacea]|uniref:Uncharacterized protein n=1 Tax=Mycena albidolilacea TaxID=1033008 RepID=A0AAD6Z8P1_9AGAR|nr:hypothetical protein DFH08DRAFT_943704 [Mycena albidolilacea]